MIDPTAVSTIRVGELPSAPFNLTDNIPHEVGVDLKKGTIEELSTFISAYIGATDAVGFRAISVTDGQTLPTTAKEEFILVGKGTFYNVAGGSTIVCTEELNAIVSNGSFWFIGVEIPVNIELSGVTQFIRQGFIDTTPSEDVVYDALALKVPYTGATTNVSLGEFQLSAGQITFDQTPTQTAGVGVLRWNDTDGTLDLGLKGGNVTLQLGQEQIVRVVNKTGSNLTEAGYQAVYTSGAQGQRLKVDLALANSDLTSNGTLGLVTENISVNQEGFVTTNGLVRGINTTGSLQSETWADGDILYLSPITAGRITNIKPIAPQHLVVIGVCVYAHITQGSIFVKVDNGYELDELHNVLISSLANNDVLVYESSSTLWKNKTISSALGYTPENIANKSDSYTVSSSTTYASSKAVVDGLATKAESTGGTGYIQNQNASAQSANFNITGTNSYIGTANFYNSPTSLYPAFFKNAATSFNIKGITDQDINIINQGTGMTTISGGWGLGFKADVAGTSNGPDYGIGVAGINYRPPTESMTKNFLLIRAGQYVFEDDNADWQMIITPTGVNIGGGATPVGGAVPVNKFEVDGNACIGENYDRVYSAPPNGLIVEGSSGFGTYTPSTNFITEFASASSLGFPTTSGSAQTGGTLRIRNAGSDAVLDIGNNSGSGAWLQSTNRGNLSSNYPLLFNPNGGNVLIGTTTDNGNKLRVNGSGYFDGGVSIPLSNSYSINGGRFVFHNGTTYLGDVDNISPGSSTIIRSGGSDAISITSAGVTRISSLAGTGTRTVVADASGNLSTTVGYKVYTALVSQTGTSAPTAVVLENTTGATITFARIGGGMYTATFSSAVLTTNKTTMSISSTFTDTISSGGIGSTTIVNIYTTIVNPVYAFSDGRMSSSTFEVRIYN